MLLCGDGKTQFVGLGALRDRDRAGAVAQIQAEDIFGQRVLQALLHHPADFPGAAFQVV